MTYDNVFFFIKKNVDLLVVWYANTLEQIRSDYFQICQKNCFYIAIVIKFEHFKGLTLNLEVPQYFVRKSYLFSHLRNIIVPEN